MSHNPAYQFDPEQLEDTGRKARTRKANGSDLGNFAPTEDGIALAFAARHRHQLRYCHHVGSWYIWTGTHWQKEETKLAFSWARDLCRDLNRDSSVTLSKAATAAAVERFAQTDREFAVTSEVWDANSWALGTPSGVVDLRTGDLRQPAPEDHITKITSIGPAPVGTEHPLWSRFLHETTGGDVALQRFLQQVAGYCLTGDTREHALFFVYGPGGNGKSVFLNTLANILGDYATTAPMDSFTASSLDRHPTDLAMLRGARLVSVSETEEGRAWAESRIKQLTGGDRIQARFMRRDFFEYRPQFKLLIVGNHKPVLRNVDDAARRRFNIIPFIRKPETPDRQLEEKLRAEYPAILRWMILGCLDWQDNGLVRPPVVLEATASYFDEQDLFTQWLDECCDREPGYADTTAVLFTSWKKFAEANGEQAGSTKSFGQNMVKAGFRPIKNTPGAHGKRGFAGVAVRRETAGYDFND